jgi:hypothetical protein
VRDVLIGSAATLVGAVFCFAGHVARRVVIPLWGAMSGFFIGAGIVASLTDDHDSRGWYFLYLALVIGGITVQLLDLDRARRTVADSWRASAASPTTPWAAPGA